MARTNDISKLGRRASAALLALALALLFGASACVGGPLDPIIQEQENPHDPTKDPTDGNAFDAARASAVTFV